VLLKAGATPAGTLVGDAEAITVYGYNFLLSVSDSQILRVGVCLIVMQPTHIVNDMMLASFCTLWPSHSPGHACSRARLLDACKLMSVGPCHTSSVVPTMTINGAFLLPSLLQERDMCSEPAASNEFALQLHRVHLGDLVGASSQPAAWQQPPQCLPPALCGVCNPEGPAAPLLGIPCTPPDTLGNTLQLTPNW
jgi:hypothetical protein